jgi:hypothetical protein
MVKFIDARLLIYLWIIGLIVAGSTLFFFGQMSASLSYWDYCQGWQNEIAIWNLSMIIVLIGILKSKKGNESYVIPGLVVMSLCFSINHILAMYRGGGMPLTHLSATLANMGGVFLGLIYYIIRKKS